METQILIEKFGTNHRQFFTYVNTLNDGEFVKAVNGKWTPGQQLEHVLKCNQPLLQILKNKALIMEKFGLIQRPVWDYDEVIKRYTEALTQGGVAPGRFVPERVEVYQRDKLAAQALRDVEEIEEILTEYSDAELDSLVLPHPLLGSLTIREMMCLMAYHAVHHHQKTIDNLHSN